MRGPLARERRTTLAREYVLAVAAVLAATMARWLFDPVLGDHLPFVTYFVAILLVAYYTHIGPSVAALLLGAVAAQFFFSPPRLTWTWQVYGVANQFGFAMYFMVGIASIFVCEKLRHARLHAEVRRNALRITLASIGDAVITTDAGGRVTYLNPVAESLTGWTSEAASGRPLDEVFHIVNEQTRQRGENPAVRALREGVVVGLANHTLLIKKDNGETPIDDSAAPIRDENDSVIGVVLVFRDITQRRQAEQATAHLAAIVKSSDDAIVSKNLQGIIMSWNAGAERLFGYTAKESVGQSITMLIPPDRQDEEPRILKRIARGDRVDHYETVRRRKDGKLIDVSLSISPITDAQGEIVGASKIARDISERKRMESELRQYVADLSEADRRKNEFLAMLAHELRNPLAPIRNALNILQLSQQPGGAAASATDMMNRQLAQLVRLVDDLLDISRISRGKIELQRQHVEVASVVHHAVETSKALANCQEREFEVMLPTEPIYVDADPTRLAQVIGNLLNNACKFTEAGGRISLAVSAVETESQIKTVEIRVSDTGIGIAAHQLPHVFDMFMQADTSLERSAGGLGIGLTLVKNLVEMHGGTIEAHSAGLGKGSEFVVRLPVLAETELEPAEPVKTTPASSPPRRILVVDDNLDSAHSLAMLLNVAGHETLTVHDGLEAVDAAANFKPDVALLDIGLPKLNGYEAARRIREQPWAKEVVLIALTGWGQEEDRQKSKAAGFDAHLVKPVDFAALQELLADHRPAG